MKDKPNEESHERFEGERILNDSILEIDLHQFIKRIKEEERWVSGERNSITIFKSETMRIVLIALKADAELKSHKADGVISVQVLEGSIQFLIEQKSSIIQKDCMVTLLSGISHSVKAVTESFFLLTISLDK